MLAKELHKPVIKNFETRKINARFNDTIWAADLTETGSLSSFNRGIKCFLRETDLSTKYVWVQPLADKKVLHGFIEIVNKSKRKPNKLWVCQGREFYNKLLKKWLDDNDILMCLTYNEGKSVVGGRFIRTLKGEIYKKTTARNSCSHLQHILSIS